MCFLRHVKRQGPRHLGDGLVVGLRKFAVGIGYGLLGVGYDPIQGWKNQRIVGLGKGLVKGLFGLPARPVIGVSQLFLFTLWGLAKTPGTCFKSIKAGTMAKDEKVIKHFQEEFPKFSVKELTALNESFVEATAGTGLLNREQFGKCFAALGMGDSVIASRMFDQFDKNKKNSVNSKEFLTTMYIMMRGDIDEKLSFAFDMYDLDSNGIITRGELVQVISDMQGCMEALKIDQKFTAAEYADYVFSKLDTEGDGKITRERFVDGMKRNVDIIKGLGIHRGNHTSSQTVIKKKGITVSFMSSNWDMVLNMMLGIRVAAQTSPSRESGEIGSRLPDEMYGMKRNISLPSNEIGAATRSDQEEKYAFADYAPLAFAEIRSAFGYEKEDYMASLGPEGLMGSLLMGNLASLSEIMSEGKSGSFFYFSDDMRFMVKTISHEEFVFFRKILRGYHQHVISNPCTLLSRLLGLYKIKITKPSSVQRISFIVMNNLFYTNRTINRRYDLKGSLIGRVSTEQEREDATIALKDQDLDIIGDRISLDPETHAFVGAEIKKDVAFLAEHDIMDYSMLVGISELGPEEMEEPIEEKQGHPLERHLGGVRGLDAATGQPGKYIYYIGIIDILIHYNARKAAETQLRGAMGHDKTKISAVPAGFYSERFLQFMLDHMDLVDPNRNPISNATTFSLTG